MKQIQIIVLSIIFSLFCICPADAKLFDGTEFFLQNGMRVIVLPNHKAPIVAHQVWYKTGAMDDSQTKAGTAHLLEHLMFKGTRLIKDFDKIITENGGEGNAMTSYDFTAYHQKLDISKLELAMFLEADRMKNLVFDNKEFIKERDVVFNERKQVVENNPTSEFNETFRRNLWQDHPYSRPVIGTADEIMSLKLDDVQTYYKEHYHPSNAILIIAGDIDPKTAKTLAEKYYGHITPSLLREGRGGSVNNPSISSLQNNRENILIMNLPNIQNPRYLQEYITPNKNYALEVLAKYLGDGKTSELYKSLVLNKKALLNISTNYDGYNRGPGSFSVSALLKDDADPTTLITQAMQKAVDDMSEKDLQKTKDKMLSGLIFLKDNPFDAAFLVGYMSQTMSLTEIESWADNINNVTLTDIKTAYIELQQSPNQTGLLLPLK